LKSNLKMYKTKLFFYVSLSFLFIVTLSLFLTGCSAGKEGLLSITPQQYFYSAKEKLETVDERSYEIRDLDEIIRVLENAEKDAKSSEIMDKARMYLTLACTLKARKQYFSNRMKGQYLANRAEPFYALDVKPVLDTLRVAKKWLRSCEAGFKSNSLANDLQFVKAFYYTHKMLTQKGIERTESLWTAVESYRRCLGAAPDYQSDFRLFGKTLTRREVRLKLIECLAFGGEIAEAYALLSDYEFSPNPTYDGAFLRQDFPWLHMKGLLLAMMGKYVEAEKVLSKFKIIAPQDYPVVEEALWVLEGVFDRLKETTNDDHYRMEARVVASLLKELKGPFSKEKYTTAAHIFPRWLPGDLTFFNALISYYDGDHKKTAAVLKPLKHGGVMSKSNRVAARVLALENDLYGGNKVPDESIEEILGIAMNKTLSLLMKERIGFLLARYVLGDEIRFKSGPLESDSQTFVKSITGKPWVLKWSFKRGDKTPSEEPKTPRRKAAPPSRQPEPEKKRDSGSLLMEMYANRPDDWIISANLNLLTLPQISLIGKGRLVGREEEEKGWVFKGEDVDELRRGGHYLAIVEFANSDSEKSFQGILLNP